MMNTGHKLWYETVDNAETYEELSDPALKDYVMERMDQAKKDFWIGAGVWIMLMVSYCLGFMEGVFNAMLMALPLLIMASSAFLHSECVSDITFLEEKKIYSILSELWEEPYVASEEGPGPEIA